MPHSTQACKELPDEEAPWLVVPSAYAPEMPAPEVPASSNMLDPSAAPTPLPTPGHPDAGSEVTGGTQQQEKQQKQQEQEEQQRAKAKGWGTRSEAAERLDALLRSYKPHDFDVGGDADEMHEQPGKSTDGVKVLRSGQAGERGTGSRQIAEAGAAKKGVYKEEVRGQEMEGDREGSTGKGRVGGGAGEGEYGAKAGHENVMPGSRLSRWKQSSGQDNPEYQVRKKSCALCIKG